MVALLCVLASVAQAEPAVTRPRLDNIVVLELRGVDVPAGLLASAEETVLVTLRTALPLSRILGKTEIVRLLEAESDKQLVGCDDDACMAEIAGALGAAAFVSGNLGKVGSGYNITLKLFDGKAGSVAKQLTEQASGNEKKVLELVARMTVALSEAGDQGYLSVNIEGELLVGGKVLGAAPVERLAVSPGHYTIEVRPKRGKKVVQQNIDIQTGREVIVGKRKVEVVDAKSAADLEAPTPWYGRWWVWTIVGVVLIGGGVAIAVAASEGATGGQGNVQLSLTPAAGEGP